jgi:hypothetical protein
MCLSAAQWAHLVQHDAYPRLGRLEGSFASGKASANHMEFGHERSIARRK